MLRRANRFDKQWKSFSRRAFILRAAPRINDRTAVISVDDAHVPAAIEALNKA